MRLNYNFKVGSLFEWRGIPIRIIVLMILIPSLVTYYCLGFMSVKRDLSSKSGIVDKVRIFQSSSGWEANFTLRGDSSTTYSQSYTTASKIFLVFPQVFKVAGYTIHPGDTITFYVDKSKKGIYIKTFGQPTPWDSFESEGVVYTEGLIVNGETIANPVVVSFTRTWLDTIGGMVGILFYLAIALFTFDYCWWYRQKEIDTKLTSFFTNRNRFIQ